MLNLPSPEFSEGKPGLLLGPSARVTRQYLDGKIAALQVDRHKSKPVDKMLAGMAIDLLLETRAALCGYPARKT